MWFDSNPCNAFAGSFGDTDSEHSNEESACGAAVRSADASVADNTANSTESTSDAYESDTGDDPRSFTVSALVRTDVRSLSTQRRSAFLKALLAEILRYSVDYEWLNSCERACVSEMCLSSALQCAQVCEAAEEEAVCDRKQSVTGSSQV